MKYLCAFIYLFIFWFHLALLQFYFYQMAMWGEFTGPESLNTHSKRTENFQFSWLLYSYSWRWHCLRFREHRKLETNSSVGGLLNHKQIMSKCRADLEMQICSSFSWPESQLKLYQMSQEQQSVYLLWTEKDMVDANQRDSLQSQDAPVTHF